MNSFKDIENKTLQGFNVHNPQRACETGGLKAV